MIDESDKLIGLIYEGIADDVHWGAALERVAAFVGAAGVGWECRIWSPTSSEVWPVVALI
jgi:hypothetical protein